MSRLILGRSVTAPRTMGFTRQTSAEAGELITYSGDGHLVTLAPSETGKTSGPVITNALTHPGQLIVLDMKGEVFAATAEATRFGSGCTWSLCLMGTSSRCFLHSEVLRQEFPLLDPNL